MTSERIRVAVTGVSAVTALGTNVFDTFRRLVAGERAFTDISEFDTSCSKIHTAAEIKNFRVSDVAPAGKASLYSRADALALCAVEQALVHARAHEQDLFMAVGGTSGGMRESEPILMAGDAPSRDAAVAQRLLSYPIYSSTNNIVRVFPRIRHTSTFCSACSSSATAVAQAASWVASGRCACALAGGTDSLCLLTLTGFAALGAMSPEPCRPFDAARAGMSLGEGAAFLVLESEANAIARNAEILAWLDGWTLGAEAHHITHPESTGERSASLISAAARRAGLSVEDVGYYNAHGTGTIPNDSMETNAVRIAFGDAWPNVRVSTAKGQLGHTLGAAGAVEAAMTLLALREGMLPATGGLETPAQDAELNHVVGVAVPTQCRYAISGSFGFGGLGAVLAFARVDTANRLPCREDPDLVITGLTARATASDPLMALDPERSRRFDRVTALTCLGAVESNRNAGESGLVVSNACGNIERLQAYLQRLSVRGLRGIPPAEFPHLVPSAISGNTSIYAGLKGPTTNVSDGTLGFEKAILFACNSIEQGLACSMVVGVAEANDTGAMLISDPFDIRAGFTNGDVSVWLCVENGDTARRNGTQALARVVDIRCGLTSWWQYFVENEAPTHMDRVRLFLVGIDRCVPDVTPGIGQWTRAERIVVNRARDNPAGRSGEGAIAHAIEAISNGQCDESLVISRQHDEFFAFRLVKVNAG